MNKIKFTVCTLAVSCVLAIGGFAQATSFGPISDNYWGGTPYDNSARDIVGTNEGYDVVSISGNITKSLFSVTIKSNYFDNIGSSGTALGDFFISTNGWNPIGTAADHYQNDTLNNGEKWEFALVFDQHTPTNTSGNLSLYSLIPSNYSSEVKLSNSFFGPNDGIRKDQEVQVNTT
ncbi:MAG: hypothetical protein Q8R88_02600, partial [Desulfoprunum sp.]|nr:hypothetical protein [Desulfoprunum sp.]